MKAKIVLLTIIFSMFISSLITYFVMGTNTDADDNPNKETAELRKRLIQAKSESTRAPRVEIIETKVFTKGVVTDAKGLIEKLSDKNTIGDNIESQKRIIHYFESLVDGGNDSVTVIDNFLAKDLNKEFLTGRPVISPSNPRARILKEFDKNGNGVLDDEERPTREEMRDFFQNLRSLNRDL